MPEQELNLLQFTTCRMTQSCTCPSDVVRCAPFDASFAGVLANEVPNRYFGEAVAPNLSDPADPAKDLAGIKIRRDKPFIE